MAAVQHPMAQPAIEQAVAVGGWEDEGAVIRVLWVGILLLVVIALVHNDGWTCGG